MTADIIPMKEPRRLRLRRALDEWYGANEQWVEKTMTLAFELKAARDECGANDVAYGHWLVENACDDLGKNDRVAFIGLADNSELSRRVLLETSSNSIRLIWEKQIKPLLTCPSTGTDTQLVVSPVETPEIAPPVPSAPNPTVENEPPKMVATRPVSKRSAFYGLERAAEVEAIYTISNARSLIKEVITRNPKIGREIWALILAAIDAGIMAPTSAKFLKVTARILFPDGPMGYCNRIDLTNVNDRRDVRERILPAVIANKDAFLAAPMELENIVTAYGRQQRVARLEAVAKQVAIKVLPGQNETTVVMYGVQLWPRIEHQYGEYDYDQIRTAVWTFRDIMSWLDGSKSGNSPESCAIIVRLTTKWMGEYMERALPQTEERWKVKKIYSLISAIATLLEKNSGSQCLIPPTPKNEGQW